MFASVAGEILDEGQDEIYDTLTPDQSPLDALFSDGELPVCAQDFMLV